MILKKKTYTHLVVKALLPAHRCVAAPEASPQPPVPARDPHPGPTAGARGEAGPQVAVAESPPGPGRFPVRQNPKCAGDEGGGHVEAAAAAAILLPACPGPFPERGAQSAKQGCSLRPARVGACPLPPTRREPGQPRAVRLRAEKRGRPSRPRSLRLGRRGPPPPGPPNPTTPLLTFLGRGHRRRRCGEQEPERKDVGGRHAARAEDKGARGSRRAGGSREDARTE